MSYPTIKELAELIKSVKSQIGYGDQANDEDTLPGIRLTCAINETGSWSYQTGCNSYTGGAYQHPHWAVVSIYRRTNARETAKEILSEWRNLKENRLDGFTVQLHCDSSNWANPEACDVRHAATKHDASTLLQDWSETVGRYDDPRQVSALVWHGTLDDVTDQCPDFQLTIGPRMGIHWQPA
jgi:hypothetical protein